MFASRFGFTLVTAILLAALCSSEQEGLLQSLPADILASLTEGDLLTATGGNVAGEEFKGARSILDSLTMDQGADIGAAMKMMQSVMTKQTMPTTIFKQDGGSLGSMKPGFGFHKGVLPVPVPGKVLKALPLKALPLKTLPLKKKYVSFHFLGNTR